MANNGLITPKRNLMLKKDEKVGMEKPSVDQLWKVMIVDDDREVHNLTKLVLGDFAFNGRSLAFFSAYTASEAIEMLDNIQDIALVFLDVVMEKEDSGLQVVRHIRQQMHNRFMRIVLRTGQPGQAPEESVIRDYDINDYKEKTELTARKLYTVTISSLRAYQDLMTIENNRRVLEKIIESSTSIFEVQSMNEFITGVLMQLISLLRLGKNTMHAPISGFAANRLDGSYKLLAATGGFDEGIPGYLVPMLEEAVAQRKSKFTAEQLVLYFKSKYSDDNLIYVEGFPPIDILDMELIEIFSANVSIAFDNIHLNREIEDTQKEIIFSLGEIAEARSKETGSHVKRVSEYCRLLALEYGLPEEEAAQIYIASTMHDVGKLAVPDAILNKPGKLTPEEFEVVKLHAQQGYDMLGKSNRPVMKIAAVIALQHHEKYNGSGYPRGLKGEEIHIYGRIAALADVFDALGTARVYKPAWELCDILEFMKKEKGEHFDPRLIDIFFDKLDKFLEIRDLFND